jgi:hypothetical protein
LLKLILKLGILCAPYPDLCATDFILCATELRLRGTPDFVSKGKQKDDAL